MPRRNMRSMFLDPVVPSDVLLTTYNLKPKLSQGYDGISTKLLKETISNILQPITHIINRSFVTGIVPQDLKIAKIIPIYKSSDQSLLQNYRPVSFTTSHFQNIREISIQKVTVIFGTHFIQAPIRLSPQVFNYTPNHSASKLLCRI